MLALAGKSGRYEQSLAKRQSKIIPMTTEVKRLTFLNSTDKVVLSIPPKKQYPVGEGVTEDTSLSFLQNA